MELCFLLVGSLCSVFFGGSQFPGNRYGEDVLICVCCRGVAVVAVLLLLSSVRSELPV